MGKSNASLGIHEKPPATPSSQVTWGRTGKATWINNSGATCLITLPALLVLTYSIALEDFNGSISATARSMASQGILQFARAHLPQPSIRAFLGYASWISLQALLYAYLPGKLCHGQRTPGGHLLSYTTNGLLAWAITHLLYLAASVGGWIDPAIIAKSWPGLLIAANTYGFAVTVLTQLKAHLAPTYPSDCKFTGSTVFDFWGGIELNPRIGKHFDLKFFHNGRPGIIAWTLIDLSWAAHQYQTHGTITTSMLLVITLHTLYVLDFFRNESWYLRTIDINHDHFGFMLAWGDTTFLPTFYTLQTQYLARHPVLLTPFQTTLILAAGMGAYTIFRLSNNQKDLVRGSKSSLIWGRPAAYITCSYLTADGQEHQSILLTSGWWGICRHANYTADLILAGAMCAPCGFAHALPWSYFVYMCVLLGHRIRRDEARCWRKYGDKWEEYCRVVPWRLVPGVY